MSPKTIPLIKPYISYNDVSDDLKEIFDSGIFTKGPYQEKLRHELSSYTGFTYTHLTSSATTALSVSLVLLGIKPGDEVIVSDLSFPATANVVQNIGAIPVFADVDLSTFNTSACSIRSLISESTKAIIFVSTFGNRSNLNSVLRIAREHSLPVIEDAACALGSTVKLSDGLSPDLVCYSFHPRKLICSGEGGAIQTNKQIFSEQLNLLLNHGATFTEGSLIPSFVTTGFNYRLPEIQASMILKQLPMLDSIIQARSEAFHQYCDFLLPHGFSCQLTEPLSTPNYQSLVFTVPASIQRNQLIRSLRSVGIESTIGTYSTQQPAFLR